MNDPYSNVLVTGGAGFIGSNFIQQIYKSYPRVHVTNVDCLTYAANLENLRHVGEDVNYELVQADIRDTDRLAALFERKNFDAIVHFAAESHVDNSIESPDNFITTNINGTFNLLDAAKRQWLKKDKISQSAFRFIHVSTDEVYGSLEPNDPAFTEQTPYKPNSPYSASKAASDHLCRSYYHTYGLPTIITHCSNNYGPNQHNEKLIPTVINACQSMSTIPVYGNGLNIRDWIHVSDHCNALLAILSSGTPGEVYNIGGNQERNNLELVKLICSIFDDINPENAPHSNLISFVTDRPGHDWRYAIDNSKITRELDWNPKTKLREGIKDLVESILDRVC